MSPELRETLVRFRALPAAERFHVRARAASCPLEAVAAQVPAGSVLDLGCGHGLFSLFLARDEGRHVRGIDLDPRKIASAQMAQVPTNVEFAVGTFEREPEATYDAIAVLDVLYLVPRERWDGFIAACFTRLKPGGRLVLKEAGTEPRWKYFKAWLQELAMARLLGRTRGEAIGFEPRERLEERLKQAGFEQVQGFDVSAGYTTPHMLVVGTRPR